MENFLPTPQGGAIRRPGFRYIASTKTASEESRLVPFTFSTTQAYIIEFGDLYARFYKDGGQIWTEDAETMVLLHNEGEDAGVTFTDSANGHTITANGTVQTDTDRKYFGLSSAFFDGDSDYLSISDHADFDFGAAEFTIDSWIYVDSSSSGTHPVYEQYKDADEYFLLQTYLVGDDLVILFNSKNVADNVLISGTVDTAYTPGWHHIAVIRGWGGTTNNFAITWDGSSIDTNTVAHTMATMTTDVNIGRQQLSGTSYLDGSIDELRVSKGSARWTANFDPCETEYPFCDESGSVYELATTYTEPDLDDRPTPSPILTI
jgi:hypothetical protein